jgi:hypothetical protein
MTTSRLPSDYSDTAIQRSQLNYRDSDITGVIAPFSLPNKSFPPCPRADDAGNDA